MRHGFGKFSWQSEIYVRSLEKNSLNFSSFFCVYNDVRNIILKFR